MSSRFERTQGAKANQENTYQALEASEASSNSGDALEREFERLYLESFGPVYNYVRYRMANADAAEDVVAEAFLLAARSFTKFDPSKAKFSTWVTKIAINCMNGYYRKNRPMAELDVVPEATLARPGEQDAIAEREYVDSLLAVLDETERQLVVMKYREGFRNVDIAEELGMNASTVSTTLARALAKMRELV